VLKAATAPEPQRVRLTSYTVHEGARQKFSEKDAEIAGPVLAGLHAQGRLNATAVVQEAERLNSPIRRYFEWDNLRAAHAHRLHQAETLIQAIIIPGAARTEDPPRETRFVRDPAAPPIRNSSRGPRIPEWKSETEQKTEAWVKAQQKKRALTELLGWRQRHQKVLNDPLFCNIVHALEVVGKMAEAEDLAD
jgi:hypothetical protein